jgi:hypothetical protein
MEMLPPIIIARPPLPAPPNANGMRRGELLALQWMDFDFRKKTMSIHKAIWHQQVGPVKTMESERIMPLDDEMVADLLAWRKQTTYAKDTDWVFASSRMKGRQPLWPEGVMKNHVRPAAKRAGITKHITWHSFRHTFSTLLVGNGEELRLRSPCFAMLIRTLRLVSTPMRSIRKNGRRNPRLFRWWCRRESWMGSLHSATHLAGQYSDSGTGTGKSYCALLVYLVTSSHLTVNA